MYRRRERGDRVEQDSIGRWCGDVVRRIRFRHDRAAVAEELRSHLEESRDFLMQEEGLSQAEAERAAIAAMGDPEELGKELNQVHSPLLGWLWLLSRWMVRVLIAFLAGFIITNTGKAEDVAFWFATQRDPTLAAPPWVMSGAKYFTLPDDGICVAAVTGEPVEVGAYTISVLKGELRRWRVTEVEPGTEPYDHYELTVLLRIDSSFWRQFPYGMNQAYAVDSQGNLFTVPDAGRADGDILLWTSSYVETTMPAWTKGIAVIPNVSTAESWSPQWVELRLPEEIGDFTYRLELEYMEVAP